PCIFTFSSSQENAAHDTEDRKPSDDLEVSEAEQATEEGNTSAGGIVTESDPDLEVEYREHSDNAESLSGSETVNQDDDSFSVLGGDSLNGQDLPEHEMPPLFVHLICSVTHKHQHGSMPVLTLPTCLGESLRTWNWISHIALRSEEFSFSSDCPMRLHDPLSGQC
ncbi:hypothetical protein AB205_0001770, partial [Aquarana catesbeiana]